MSNQAQSLSREERTASKIVAEVCNRLRNSDLYASNKAITTAFDQELNSLRATCVALEQKITEGTKDRVARDTQLSAEWPAECERLESENDQLRATLAQYEAQLSEAWKEAREHHEGAIAAANALLEQKT